MARQPTVRPDSAETRPNHEPSASTEAQANQRSHEPPGGSFTPQNGLAPSSSDTNLDEVLKLVAEQACLATAASASAIALSDGDEIVCRAAAGANAPDLGVRLDTSSGLTGACVRTRKVQYCEDTDTDSRVNAAACRRLQVRSVLVLPLLHHDELLGVLEIFSPFPQAFARHDLQNLEALSQVILDNVRPPAQESPVFPAAEAPSAEGASWMKMNVPPAPVEPAPPLLELSEIRWEPPEAQADVPPPGQDASHEYVFRAPEPVIPEPAAEKPKLGVSDLFFPPHLESFALDLTPPKPPMAAVPPLPVAPPQPEPPAYQPHLSPPPSSARPANEPRPRDWTTGFLTVTVIGVALLLGWMLGHASWQHVAESDRAVSASPSNSARVPSGGADPSSVDASDANAVSPAPSPKPGQGVSRPGHASSQPKSVPDARPDGGLVVYEGGKIIFQQAPSKPGHGDSESKPSPGRSATVPGDPVSLSPEVASSYLVQRVEPVYPEEARLRSVEGDVHLEALVGTDGSVQVLRLISGNTQLAQAAADAVRQWRFRPYRSNGKTEEFNTRLTVSFRLQ